MADSPEIISEQTVDSLKQAGEAAEDTSKSIDALSTSAAEATDNTKDLGEAVEGANTSLDKTKDKPQNFEALKLATDGASKAMSLFQDMSSNVADRISNLDKKYGNVADSAGLAAAAFGNLYAFGAQENFTNLSNIDTDKLITYKNEAGKLVETFKTQLAGGNIKAITDKISGMIGKVVDPKKIAVASAKGESFLTGYINKILTVADNVKRLQNFQIQLAASTGDLGAHFAAAGDKLQHLGELAESTQTRLDGVGKLTGLDPSIINKYYSELGRIPGALDATTTSLAGVKGKSDAFTAAIQLAHGTGKSFTEVTQDMDTAMRNYASGGIEGALKFTAQISEVSNKYNLRLQDVRKTLTDVSEGFKFFGNEASGAAALVNTYVDSIRSTGISGTASLEIVKNMTDGVKNLTLAQKAYLSSQSGGPGGLQGAYDIELKLREGKINEVFESMKDTLTSKMGKAVTLEEASGDRQAAAQRTKQIQMIMNGPLGDLAGGDATKAGRILDGFAKNEKGEKTIEALDKSPELALRSTGNTLLERNNHILAQSNRMLESQQHRSERGVSDALGAATTTGDYNTKISTRMEGDREKVRAMRDKHKADLTAIMEEQTSRMAGKEVTDQSKQRFKKGIIDTVDQAKITAGTVGTMGHEIKDKIMGYSGTKTESEMHQDQMNTARSTGKTPNRSVNTSPIGVMPALSDVTSNRSKLPGIDVKNMSDEQITMAAKTASDQLAEDDKKLKQLAPSGVEKNTQGTVPEFNVNITAHCPDCFKKAHVSQKSHEGVVNVTSQK